MWPPHKPIARPGDAGGGFRNSPGIYFCIKSGWDGGLPQENGGLMVV